jgi:nitrate reductase (cytochrome), electron transfer subunit
VSAVPGPDRAMPDLEHTASRAGVLPLAMAVVIGVAVIGFVAGTRRPPPVDAIATLRATSADAPVDVPAARSYGELARQPWRKNDLAPSLATLAATPAAPEDPPTPAAIAAARADRTGRRAYAGAPPVIPHPIAQRGAPDCLACHAQGMSVDGRRAPAMSHAPYASCTQCHVPAASPLPVAELAPEAIPLDSRFTGTDSLLARERAHAGAPPVIPHAVSMRERCLSCHGPSGHPGLRTTHPERRSCTQCHAPSAALDQRADRRP